MFYFTMLMLILILMLIIFFINMFLMIEKPMNSEKNTPFECGYNIITKPSLPFSIPFYLIMLLFLIFDIEIILMLPMINYMIYMNNMIISMSYLLLLWILLITVIYEYLTGYLNWIF